MSSACQVIIQAVGSSANDFPLLYKIAHAYRMEVIIVIVASKTIEKIKGENLYEAFSLIFAIVMINDSSSYYVVSH